jgi:hypothetical protein
MTSRNWVRSGCRIAYKGDYLSHACWNIALSVNVQAFEGADRRTECNTIVGERRMFI